MTRRKKKDFYKEVKELRHNKKMSIEELARHYGKSKRTIYRWLKKAKQVGKKRKPRSKKPTKRKRKYPEKIFIRIIELKKEVPQRSAPMIHRLLKKEFQIPVPSISTVRKFIRAQGLTTDFRERSQGYKRFERKKPNDLWQIDIAGKQTVGYLGPLYLIGLIDDHSRFVVAAEYFKDQKGTNVIKVIRDAVMEYGRPNQILADNGTQFRNLIGDLGTKYSRLLEYLDIEPIFATPRHPETKGKIERWFGTVRTMFLVEGRHYIKTHEKCSLFDFNGMFQEWVEWYNMEKSHRNLPDKKPPGDVFFKAKSRISQPLKAQVNWKRWLHEVADRKVSKYNEISYKAQRFEVPPGYAGTRVDVIEYEDEIEIYSHDNLLITHPYQVKAQRKRKTRKILHNGTIAYKGTYYNIDYKLAGKTVEIQEINDGQSLLVYLNGLLMKEINL